jgi:signal transduction histidine kinase
MYDAERLQVYNEHIELVSLTKEVVLSLKPQAEKLQADMSMTIPDDFVHVLGDRQHLVSVLYNLVDNALKYRNDNPAINISLKTEEGFAIWKVKDNGPGIAKEYLRKVFDKFFRVPQNDRHDVKGYGLGLAYVEEVVKQMNGTITVESETQKGSTFIVKLPLDHSNGDKA